MSERLLLWRGLGDGGWRAHAARVGVEGGRLLARGTQLGSEPDPYRLDYTLDTVDRFLTERLAVTAYTGAGELRLELERRLAGDWRVDETPRPDLAAALDCDLGLCPLTNTMPVLRERLQAADAEALDLEVAWVSVPDLAVHRAPQRYEPIDERSVRFVSRDSSFSAELALDPDGFVLHYPEVAERVPLASLEAR
jgi:uncharacterized protein